MDDFKNDYLEKDGEEGLISADERMTQTSGHENGQGQGFGQDMDRTNAYGANQEQAQSRQPYVAPGQEQSRQPYVTQGQAQNQQFCGAQAQTPNRQFYGAQAQAPRFYGAPAGAGAPYPPKQKGMPGWLKFILILALVFIFIIFSVASCSNALSGMTRMFSGTGSSADVIITSDSDYIGVIHINGTIMEGISSTYNLNAIDAMMEDKNNKGIVMVVETPGGSVFTSDEIYFKILEYQEKTKRPVYSSMQSMAASGGYYISAPCEKIIANRNCWTGSIGVTLGTMYDVSGLLEKLGVTTTTITSGVNKAMGASDASMTEEQKAIFQSLVDEAYEQFVDIVATGRNMDVAKVKELADGRIYTAKQALDNGLIDMIGTYEEALADMRKEYKLEGCDVEMFFPPQSTSLLDLLSGIANSGNGAVMDIEGIKALMHLNGKIEVMYMSNFQR